MTVINRAKRRALWSLIAALAVGLTLARHFLALEAGAWLANVRAKDKAESADQVSFDVAPGWTRIIRTDMDDAWQPLGRTGFNSFVFGAADGVFTSGSSREDPSSPRYQAWFGVYAVDLSGSDDLALDERALVAFADSLLKHDALRWAKTMGDASPTAEVTRREATGRITFLGHEVTLFEGEVATHSDLGDGESRAAAFLGRASDWRDHVTPYHPIALEGFVAVWRDADRRRLYVAWGNGARFKDLAGHEVRTWPALREEVLRMAATARVSAGAD